MRPSSDQSTLRTKILTIVKWSIGVDGSSLIHCLNFDDKGYELMTRLWIEALKQASEKRWITDAWKPAAES